MENLETRYYVNKYYNNQGKSRPWKRPVRCLCKHKDALWVHGKYVPCGRYKCQKFVDNLRRDKFRSTEIVTEREKNTAFWKQMKAAKASRVKRYARKHGISYKQADLELQLLDAMEEEYRRFMRVESEYYYRQSSEEE